MTVHVPTRGHIFIPTRGRVEKQPTYEALLGAGFSATLVCPPDEMTAHALHGRRCEAFPEVGGIAPKRQWIMKRAEMLGAERVFVFDDDLRFATRKIGEPTKFTQSTAADVAVMLKRLDRMLDQVPMAGLCNRGGANNTPMSSIPVAMNSRLFGVHCIDVEWFIRSRLRYTLTYMSDFQVVLGALTRGYPIGLLTTHTKDDIAGANAPGGCSIHRTAARLEESARALQREFPAFVTLREVKNKSTNGDWGNRVDVTIQWKKAFESGRATRDLLGAPQHPEPDWTGLAEDWEIL